MPIYIHIYICIYILEVYIYSVNMLRRWLVSFHSRNENMKLFIQYVPIYIHIYQDIH